MIGHPLSRRSGRLLSRGVPIWSSFAYCATREALLLRLRDHLQSTFHKHERELAPLERLAQQHCDPEAWGNIVTLPDYYPK
jgi:hypothetical protein